MSGSRLDLAELQALITLGGYGGTGTISASTVVLGLSAALFLSDLNLWHQLGETLSDADIDDIREMIAGLESDLMLEGTVSELYQFRQGLELYKIGNATLGVQCGSVSHDGTIINKEVATSVALATAANWIGGSSLESASEWVNVYINSSGTILLSDQQPNLSSANQVIADMRVNQATSLDPTSVVYDGGTDCDLVGAGDYALFYSDADFILGRGKGSAASASKNYIGVAKITATTAGEVTGTLTLEANHEISINQDDYIMIISSGKLLYRNVSDVYYRHLGAWWNDSSSNLVDINNQYGLNQKYRNSSYILNEGSNYTTSSTSFVAVDATNLNLNIVTNGGDLLVGFSAGVGAAGNVGYFELLVDGIVVAGNDGLGNTAYGAIEWVSFSRQLSLLPGNHQIQLQWKVYSGAIVLYAGAGTANNDSHPQLWAREVKQ